MYPYRGSSSNLRGYPKTYFFLIIQIFFKVIFIIRNSIYSLEYKIERINFEF